MLYAVKILTERYEPKEGIVSEDGSKILAKAAIVWLSQMESILFFISLLTKLDCRVLARNEVNMEAEEEGED